MGVTFRCQEGMTFEGPSYRTICQADGRWSHPLPRCYAPCVVPHISHGFVADRASGSSVPHTQTIDVRCQSQFQKTHNSTPVCKNGTWSRIPKCIPAKCTELPEAPENGLVVAPNLDHGMVGKFECRDGYMLKGHNTTQCFFGNWTGMTPWCKEVFCPFPGFVETARCYWWAPWASTNIGLMCERYETIAKLCSNVTVASHWLVARPGPPASTDIGVLPSCPDVKKAAIPRPNGRRRRRRHRHRRWCSDGILT